MEAIEEVKTVETWQKGYRFHVSIDKELRVETGAKYPDKTVVHLSFEGHTETEKQAKVGLEVALKSLRKLVVETEKTAFENPDPDDNQAVIEASEK